MVTFWITTDVTHTYKDLQPVREAWGSIGDHDTVVVQRRHKFVGKGKREQTALAL